MNFSAAKIVLDILLDAEGFLSHIVVVIPRTISNVRGRDRVIGSRVKTRDRDSSLGRIDSKDRSGKQR